MIIRRRDNEVSVDHVLVSQGNWRNWKVGSEEVQEVMMSDRYLR